MLFKPKKTLTPLTKGWSHDQKFIQKSHGETVLLRVLDKTKFSRKIDEINYLCTLDLDPVQFSQALSVELKKDKVHFVTTYLEGVDLETVLDQLSEDEQGRLGRQAGVALKQIHTQIKVKDDGMWAQRFGSKIDRKIDSYRACGITIPHDEALISSLVRLKPLLSGRPQTFQHGDYHSGNFLFGQDGNLCILDFDRWDIGDPWEEFNRITWCRELSVIFTRSMIMAYFDDALTENFFELLFLYMGSNLLGSIAWAQAYGDEEVAVTLKLIERFDQDTAHYTQVKPLWF